MRRIVLLVASAALVTGSPVLAQGHGNGGGKGGGQDKGGPPGQQGGGKGGPQGQPGGGNGNAGRGGDRGPPQGRADRGPQQVRGPERQADRGPQRARGPERQPDRGPSPARGPERQADRGPQQDRGPDRGRGDDRRDLRGPDRGNAPVSVVREDRRDPAFDGGRRGNRGPRTERVRYVDNGRYYAGAPAIIDGCPPGLARKNNGCLPPGQARRIWGNPQPYDNWYGNWSSWRDDSRYDYRYADGYLYRVDPTTSLVSAFLPLLGGALFGGNSWPQSYDDYDVPQYYDDYYGYDDSLDYRYADGAILGVNRGDNSIQGIAALLTGSDWTVGQAMPAGYDFYNVPPAYRDRYIDGADSMYRYSDGYVYQVDPTTRLVEQAIQLLTAA